MLCRPFLAEAFDQVIDRSAVSPFLDHGNLGRGGGGARAAPADGRIVQRFGQEHVPLAASPSTSATLRTMRMFCTFRSPQKCLARLLRP